MTDTLLTTHQVAAQLNCKESAVRQWAREGSLPFQSWLGPRLGYRFTQSDVAQLLDTKRREHDSHLHTPGDQGLPVPEALHRGT